MGVSIDSPSSPSADILTLVHTGGKEFLDRLSILATQKAASDKALADLNLGKDAKAAMDEAANLKNQAAIDRQAAAKELADARVQASRLSSEAADYASKSKQEWQDKITKLNAALAHLGA
jgi:hypothetical protein